MGWAAAASHGTAPAVEKAEVHTKFFRRLMKCTVGLVEFPGAGKHAPVFVGIGIAKHDLLPASPGIEQRLVFGTVPQATHDVSRTAERFNRFEKRDRHQPRIVS